MKYSIKSIWNGTTIFEDEATSFSALVEAAVKAKISLYSANLSYANLRSADLRDANLSYANLIGANLRSANLRSANLSNANLRNANLRSANLSNADLRNANLRNANLSNADLPSPTTILQAWWSGDLSDSLVADLMEFDASAHPDRTLFDKWAAGGACPYANVKIQRAANFYEKKELWGKGKLHGSYELMIRLFAERNIKR